MHKEGRYFGVLTHLASLLSTSGSPCHFNREVFHDVSHHTEFLHSTGDGKLKLHFQTTEKATNTSSCQFIKGWSSEQESLLKQVRFHYHHKPWYQKEFTCRNHKCRFVFFFSGLMTGNKSGWLDKKCVWEFDYSTHTSNHWTEMDYSSYRTWNYSSEL